MAGVISDCICCLAIVNGMTRNSETECLACGPSGDRLAVAFCCLGATFCLIAAMMSFRAPVWAYISCWVGLAFVAACLLRVGRQLKRAWRCFLLALLILCVWQIVCPSTENEVWSNVLAALPLMFSFVLDYLYENFAEGIGPAEYALDGELGTDRSGR
jgi:hypothetical protein